VHADDFDTALSDSANSLRPVADAGEVLTVVCENFRYKDGLGAKMRPLEMGQPKIPV